jgi:hypothetical protein
VVELPGSERPRTLVIAAIVALGLAALITVGHLLYRRTVDRATRLPRATEPAFEEPRNPTPVS